MDNALSANDGFLIGMYVRVPLDTDRLDHEFRDFQLGQIQNIDALSSIAQVNLYGDGIQEVLRIECSLEYLQRCRILPDTQFITHQGYAHGRILLYCHDEWIANDYQEYYVQLEGEHSVTRISEALIAVPAHRQNTEPSQQLLWYEFQNPIWKIPRDHVISSYNELHNATFGIEELVGARIVLLAHQAEVVARVLADATCRYLLADEVGLGKTIEACVILKGLYHRNPHLSTLLVVPAVLARQWHNELDAKFWLDIPIIHEPAQLLVKTQPLRCIIAAEDITTESPLWHTVIGQQWDVLIIDEAHHVHTVPTLYEHIRQLSMVARHVLMLSATPIQRRASEYLALLSLMNPHKYSISQAEDFRQFIQAQDKIRRKVVLLARDMTKSAFDAEEFVDEMSSVVKALKHDLILAELVEAVDEQSAGADGGLAAAQEALAYVSENYRIEARVIRNRRMSMQTILPQRALDTSYSYAPSNVEGTALDSLYDYVDRIVQEHTEHFLCLEYCRVLLYAGASSPHALLSLLETRIAYLIADHTPTTDIQLHLSLPATPRHEAERIQQLIEHIPTFSAEKTDYLDTLLYQVERWYEETTQTLEQIAQRHAIPPDTARFTQVLDALKTVMTGNATTKVVIFSGWTETLEALYPVIAHVYGKLAVAQFTCNFDDEELQQHADLFQSSPACRILLCDGLGGEGRNFQMADQIIHVDLPWTPGQIEQRIGRVDRLGRTGTVLSIVPFARDWPEQDLFHIWQDAFQLFTRSLSGMEIALENVQDTFLQAIKRSPRNGFAELVEPMVAKAAALREAVENEQYFESVAVNHTYRDEFERISEQYSDGSHLRDACLHWAELAGLRAEYDSHTAIVTFNPKAFRTGSMSKIKLATLPNMEEALHRSKRKHDLVIRGTFNRDIAVRREDLVFFAPGSDPWTDAIIANAIEADRGRCCAVLRRVPEMHESWQGMELFYSLSIDPRPLYAAGYEPAHIFRALGLLRLSTQHLLISEQGQREPKSSSAWKSIVRGFDKARDVHLGKRDGAISQIQHFKQVYPYDVWHNIVHQILAAAQDILTQELDEYMDELASEAATLFERQVMGLRAAYRWQRHVTASQSLSKKEIDEYERVSEALVAGIRQPIRQLESACYWILQGSTSA